MLKQYIPSFHAELHAIDTRSFDIARYPAEYMQLLLTHSTYYLHIYTQVLEKALALSGKKKEDIILLDYGAGNGLLGMFAKHCGFRKVYAIDISEPFVQAARLLNERLRLPVDSIMTGDWETAASFFQDKQKPDIVAGTDVIEHIYDLDIFFRGIKEMNPAMVTVFTTSAISSNPYKRFVFERAQRQDEYDYNHAEHSSGENPYAGLPFLEVRRRIIRENFSLPDATVEQLAGLTRGFNRTDMLDAVKGFIAGSVIMPATEHPTNTCDPITGSWTERLLTIDQYKKIYEENGFHLQVSNGFYNSWQPGLKSILLKPINFFTGVSGKWGRWLSSYILLAGHVQQPVKGIQKN